MLNSLHRGWKWTTATWLAVVLPIMAIEWIVFKSFYPNADFFTDSYTYIQAAMDRDAISYRPIGYSLFLRLLHVFAASDTLVVTVQYLLLQGAGLGLVLTLRRWCHLREGVTGLLMLFLLANPLIPYLSNYISSDALFVGLSLVWIVVLMGLWRSPAWWRLILQAALLFAIFNTRYVALFYPAVAVLTVLLTRRGWGFSLAGVVMSIGVVVLGMGLIKAQTKRETGAEVFSAFSGWQIANNALNLYTHIPVDTAGLPSAECRELAGLVQDYFKGKTGVEADTSTLMIGAAETRPSPSVTTAFMWLHSSPLHQYLLLYRKRNRLSYFDAWNRIGGVFSQYGYFVLRKHPGAFWRYYGWPSAKTFFWTDLDVFAVYNEGKTNVDKVAKTWFHYPDTRMRVAASPTIQGKLLAPLPALYFLLNIAFVVAALFYLPFRRVREKDPVFTGSFRLAAAFLLANSFFSIFASPSVFRYQVLSMMILFIFAVCAASKSGKKAVNWKQIH